MDFAIVAEHFAIDGRSKRGKVNYADNARLPRIVAVARLSKARYCSTCSVASKRVHDKKDIAPMLNVRHEHGAHALFVVSHTFSSIADAR